MKESLGDLQIINETCGGAHNSSCSVCKHYDSGKCHISAKVIKEHGEDKLKKWLASPKDHNDCIYFEK